MSPNPLAFPTLGKGLPSTSTCTLSLPLSSPKPDARFLTLSKLSTMSMRELELWLMVERESVERSPPPSPTLSVASRRSSGESSTLSGSGSEGEWKVRDVHAFGRRSGKKVGKILKDDQDSRRRESSRGSIQFCHRHLTYHLSRSHLRTLSGNCSSSYANPNPDDAFQRLASTPAISAVDKCSSWARSC
ncbi:hypothetical protein T439DRAFT_73707 [Meredithblackwellia eburnea MCA 4105]